MDLERYNTMRKILLSLIVTCIIVPISIYDISIDNVEKNDYGKIKVEMITDNILSIPEFKMEKIVEEPVIVPNESLYSLSDEEIDLLALVTMAEAEGECEEGQRLVIDTVLNRVDHEYWPNTVTEVIYQPNQFTSMWSSRVDRCEVQEYFRGLVIEELESRTNYDVVFFRAGKYSAYGTPLFQVENHYFSSFEGVD